MSVRVLLLALLSVGLPGKAFAQFKRVSAGYQLTGGSDGYVANEGRLDFAGGLGSVLGIYGGGSYISDPLYTSYYTGTLGLEFSVGDEDRFRLGVHADGGSYKGLSSNPTASGFEAGYITQIGPLDTLGFFYRFTNGTAVPVSAIRSAEVFLGPALAPGQSLNSLPDAIKNSSNFQVNEFTVAGAFNLDSSDPNTFLGLSAGTVVVSNIGPAATESASVTFPVFHPLYAYVSGTLEQSSTLGNLEFGSAGLYFLFGNQQ